MLMTVRADTVIRTATPTAAHVRILPMRTSVDDTRHRTLIGLSEHRRHGRHDRDRHEVPSLRDANGGRQHSNDRVTLQLTEHELVDPHVDHQRDARNYERPLA
jgi:hypothetical protein